MLKAFKCVHAQNNEQWSTIDSKFTKLSTRPNSLWLAAESSWKLDVPNGPWSRIMAIMEGAGFPSGALPENSGWQSCQFTWPERGEGKPVHCAIRVRHPGRTCDYGTHRRQDPEYSGRQTGINIGGRASASKHMENDHQRPDEQGNVFALPLNSRAEESFTLPSNMYTDQAVYDLEVDRIFHRTWQYVAHTTMFRNPGDYVAFRLAGQNIFAILGDDGQIRAFHNVCRHRAHELLPEGVGNVERVIVCPYHAWTYARDGRLRGRTRHEFPPRFRHQ